MGISEIEQGTQHLVEARRRGKAAIGYGCARSIRCVQVGCRGQVLYFTPQPGCECRRAK
jgi:hypothetical protein